MTPGPNATVKVFMSYRRADNPFLAGRLKDELGRAFGEDNIFYDIDSIPAGSDFREVIGSTLASVDAVIALIGSDWEPDRLARANDPVRTELGAALQTRKRIIPVLVGDTVMPEPEQLPTELEKLAYLNAVRLRSDPDFEGDAHNLVLKIERAVGGTSRSAPPRRPPVIPAAQREGSGTSRRGLLVAALAAAGVAVAIVLAFLLVGGGDDGGDDDSAGGDEPEPVDIVVSGKADWTDTGIDVTAGDQVAVTAEGEVFHAPDESVGPDGVEGPYAEGPLGETNHGGLIGRIDEDAPFLVGSDYSGTAETDGRFYLGINDSGVDNNAGQFDATVTVVTP